MIPVLQDVRAPLFNQKFISYCFALTLFFVPISTSAKSVIFPLVILSVLLCAEYRTKLPSLLAKPWSWSIIIFVGLMFLGCWWSPATFEEQRMVVQKYCKLLYLPVLVVACKDKQTRQLAVNAYLFAMIITCVSSVLLHFNYIEMKGAEFGNIFHNYIMTGYMMALAAYLSAHLSIHAQGRSRWMYALGAVFFSAQIFFFNGGRTVFIIYPILVTLFILQTLPRRWSFVALSLVSIILLGVYTQSSHLQQRAATVTDEWHDYRQHGSDNSVGYRVQFQAYAYKLFKKHIWFGNGTGSFTASFARDKPVKSWDRRLLEPHNYYWLIASEFGILGLSCIAFFIVSLLYGASQLNEMRSFAIAVLTVFIIGNLSDSLLFYSGTGFLFLLLISLCLGEMVERTSMACH